MVKWEKFVRKVINNFPNVDLIGIYDSKNNNEIPNKYIKCESFEDLLSLGIDTIFIATYVRYLSDFTIKALDKGLNVFCEKPPAMNLKEMISIIEKEKNANSVLKYGFNHRYHHSVIEAKKRIKSGNLGKILWFRGVYGKAGSIDFNKN